MEQPKADETGEESGPKEDDEQIESAAGVRRSSLCCGELVEAELHATTASLCASCGRQLRFRICLCWWPVATAADRADGRWPVH